MNTTPSVNPSPLMFFLLLFVISIPFWVIGAVAENVAKMLPINLPVSALMFVCPITAALLLVRNANTPNGLKKLLKRSFDYKRIKNKIWYVPIILLMPAVMVLSYGIMRLLELPLPAPHIPFGAIPIFFLIFFISAIGEEIGWSGYVTDIYRKDTDGRVIFGKGLAAFIHNGRYHHVTIKIYQDGMIDCWELVDLVGFKEKVRRGAVSKCPNHSRATPLPKHSI